MILSSSLLFSVFIKFALAFISSLLLWGVSSYFFRFFQYKKRAKFILQKAHLEVQVEWANAKEFLKKEREEMRFQIEQEIQENEFKIQSLKSKIEEKKKDFYENFFQKKEFLLEKELSIENEKKRIFQKQKELLFKAEKEEEKRHLLVERLESKLEISKENWLRDLKDNFVLEIKLLAEKWRQSYEEEMAFNAEHLAKGILFTVINRFSRPYCSERGLTPIPLKNLKNKTEKNFSLLRETILSLIEKKCGVDVVYHSKTESFSLSGLDPVSRELARVVLRRVLKDRHVFKKIPFLVKQIPKWMDKAKKDLFQKLQKNGDAITDELKLSGLHTNIKRVLGALRYRYSFTQNQYFHCSEVGFLCGLLSSELDLSLKKGRAAGLLHDIGKAMDHMGEGGHAVIGANFIEKNGVEKDIVHAVKAHHYDELPKTHLAYLVIAADALSGARPGARHATLNAFSQKLEHLEKIGNSFKGVRETHILSAGREVRVFVDSQEITDLKAVKLSKDIAKKIEKECFYHGQIKVNVLRRTEAKQIAN